MASILRVTLDHDDTKDRILSAKPESPGVLILASVPASSILDTTT